MFRTDKQIVMKINGTNLQYTVVINYYSRLEITQSFHNITVFVYDDFWLIDEFRPSNMNNALLAIIFRESDFMNTREKVETIRRQ